MKTFVTAIVLGAALVFGTCGCDEKTSEQTEQTAQLSVTAESLFSSAMDAALNVLASEGTQQLAIAAAESLVTSSVTDAQAQQVCNQIIESAIPALAQQISTVSTDKALTKKAKAEKKKSTVLASAEYKALVADCAVQFKAKYK